MTRGPSWLINAFNGRRIFGSGAEVGNTEMNPGGGDWTDYGSVGSSENVGVGKIEGGQVLSMELNMDVGTLKFWVDGHLHGLLLQVFDLRQIRSKPMSTTFFPLLLDKIKWKVPYQIVHELLRVLP